MKYVKKPVVINAIQWTGNNLKEIIDFIGLHESAKKWTWEEYEAVVKKEGLKIFTLEGAMIASVGDFIIKGVNGEVYPCKPDIFEKTYSVHQPKRKPLPDGTLPMTDEEKKEFKKLVNIAEDEFFERADLVKDHIQIWWRTKHCSWRYDELRGIKAIAYLLERFELTSNN